jgi:hypothetical protein
MCEQRDGNKPEDIRPLENDHRHMTQPRGRHNDIPHSSEPARARGRNPSFVSGLCFLRARRPYGTYACVGEYLEFQTSCAIGHADHSQADGVLGGSGGPTRDRLLSRVAQVG